MLPLHAHTDAAARPQRAAMKPRASIVIPTYNRARYLTRVLDALERQDTPAGTFEVVVADDGSTDDTSTVLERETSFPLIRLRQDNAGPAAARNGAIEQASGEIVIFIDDDVIPATDLVRQHLDAHAASPGVVIGRMAMPDDTRQPAWAEWEGRTLQRQYEQMLAGIFMATPRQFYTANASVRRVDLVTAGLFDASFRRAEDVELAYRLEDLGLRFRFVSEAVVTHDTPRSLRNWMLMAEQYGVYDVAMWRDHGRSHILTNLSEEFHLYRKRAIRVAARTTVGRPLLMAGARVAAVGAIRGFSAIRARRIARASCSVTFNLLYLDAVCRSMGGRTRFWSAMQYELSHLDLGNESSAAPQTS